MTPDSDDQWVRRRQRVAWATLAAVLIGVILLWTQPRWLGDPTGLTLRNPLLDLWGYLLASIVVLVPAIAASMFRRRGAPVVWGGCLVLAIAALPVTAMTLKHVNFNPYFQPYLSPDVIQYRGNEAMGAWLFLIFGGAALLVGYREFMAYFRRATARDNGGIQAVADQTVLGDARWASDGEVHRALQGHADASARPVFED